jgi:hypothetical protein
MTEQPEITGPRTLAIDIGGTGLKASVLGAQGTMLVERVRLPPACRTDSGRCSKRCSPRTQVPVDPPPPGLPDNSALRRPACRAWRRSAGRTVPRIRAGTADRYAGGGVGGHSGPSQRECHPPAYLPSGS